jgi:osmotically inducible lipoprotein OsmB
MDKLMQSLALTEKSQQSVCPIESPISRGPAGVPEQASASLARPQDAVWDLPDQGIGHWPARARNTMTSKRLNTLVAMLAAAGLTACAGMTPREHSTAVGAGIGAAAGAVLTGSPQGTAVGAAAGAVIGNQLKR